MQYLVTGKYIDNPQASPHEIVTTWDTLIHPSHQMLEKMVKDKVIAGGCFAGQRQVVFILDAESNEQVGNILASFPFWGLLDWSVLPVQTFHSADERDLLLIDKLRKM